MNKLLDVTQLNVMLQDKVILSDVNLTLAQGEILGLVGPSGCGKTTLLHTIAGFIEQQGGTIFIEGVNEITTNQMVPPEQRHIGMIFQDYALFPHLTVSKNISFGINSLTKAQQTGRVDELLNLLSLEQLADRFPHQLSGGQQQRVAIARALATRPKVILFDEPFSNIDVRLRNGLIHEIRHLLKSLHMTAIFVTHNKDEVFSFADKMAVMHHGRILQYGKPSQIFQHPNSWHVADFLQIGSWLPIRSEANKIHTALGMLTNSDAPPSQAQLLIKPRHLILNTAEGTPANAVVTGVTATEQGFHYLLDSISAPEYLAFEHLSFYSEHCFAVDDTLALNIAAHEFKFLIP